MRIILLSCLFALVTVTAVFADGDTELSFSGFGDGELWAGMGFEDNNVKGPSGNVSFTDDVPPSVGGGGGGVVSGRSYILSVDPLQDQYRPGKEILVLVTIGYTQNVSIDREGTLTYTLTGPDGVQAVSVRELVNEGWSERLVVLPLPKDASVGDWTIDVAWTPSYQETITNSALVRVRQWSILWPILGIVALLGGIWWWFNRKHTAHNNTQFSEETA